ncbi:Carboxypeptidase N subunit 2, partial [Gonioctena quinquepunctata]
LSLFGNKITTIEDGAFKNLSNLNELVLTENNIQRLGKGMFVDVPETLHVSFGDNSDEKMKVIPLRA